MKLEVINPKTFPLSRVHAVDPFNTPWQPGDFCRAWQDQKSLGTVVSVTHDEELLVLWSRTPFNDVTTRAVQQMAQQIRDEEDTQILRDLQAALGHDQDV